MNATPYPELDGIIRGDYAKRPEGFRCEEVLGYPKRSVYNAVQRGLKSGLLHKAAISLRHVRLFGDARAALEFQKANAKTPTEIRFRAPSRGIEWAKDAPIHYPEDAKGNPLWKFTVCPSPAATARTNTHE